jgi:hypothetical protein
MLVCKVARDVLMKIDKVNLKILSKMVLLSAEANLKVELKTIKPWIYLKKS